jgi:hypothetical protein
MITSEQVEEFVREGVLVVDDVLTEEEAETALDGLSMTLALHGVDTRDLFRTGDQLCKLSSAHGSGGVLDLFYEKWQMDIALNPKLFDITNKLWEAAYCHHGESKEDLQQQQEDADPRMFKWHPYGAFDCRKGYLYVDRICYRLPTRLADEIGSRLSQEDDRASSNTTRRKKNRKKMSIQRSLTPHLDCCPETFLSNKASKWRPIQCFVSLTDSLEPNQGGFEAAPGFHRTFQEWAANRPPSSKGNQQQLIPAPCIGEYTHIRPTEDRYVMERIRHVPVKAGSAVFWDNRYVLLLL